MMNIYDYLKMDHDKVSHLFKLFQDSKIPERKQEIVAYLTKELIVHAHAEQETFYRILEKSTVSREKAEHGLKEHSEIEDQIKLINTSKGKEWEDAVLHLKELVDHHVKEEEGSMFRKAKDVLFNEDACIIKEKMHNLKGTFLLWLNKQSNPN